MTVFTNMTAESSKSEDRKYKEILTMERTKQKQEANARMKLLKLHGNVIREFEKEGIVNLSENGGFLFWLDSDQQAIVDKFEAEHDALVYHVIRSFTEFGELYALLYVSKDEDEWDYSDEAQSYGY